MDNLRGRLAVHDPVRMTVLTTRQLLQRLGGRHALVAATGCGQWQRVLRGTYTDGPLDLQARALAVRLVLPAHALVGGRSALWLYGTPYVQDPDGPVEVIVPRGEVVARRAGLRVREGLVKPSDRVAVAGVPCLRPARAVVDVARGEGLPGAVAVLDAALRLPGVSRPDLELEVARAAGLRGVVLARRALALADPLAESPPESSLRVVLVEGGLAPVPQYVVLNASGRFVARVDLALVDARVALEYDGRVAHGSEQAFVRDRQRQNDLVAAGWTVLRFTATDLRCPAAILARVYAVLERSAAA